MAPSFYAALIEVSRMQTGNGHEIWLVGGRTYTNFAEAVRAQDLRLKDFFRRAGISEEELEALPERVIPEGATPENYDPESEWPISAELDKLFGQKFRLFSAAQLNSSQPEIRYLIPGVLATGQLGGIFGAFKTLKTSLAADLLISLASGTPFLGRFPVTQPGRVLFLSGESGLPALKSMARRICTERGLSLDALENLVCSPDVPKLGDPFDMMAFTELVEREKPVCVVIDPAFLALGGGRGARAGAKKSKSLFEIGQLLRPLAELCQSTGCTVLVVHHCKQARKSGEPAALENLAGSGFAEFSAQWLLVSRRRPFEPGTGHHELWLTTGSRAGDQGLWELDIDESAADQPAGGRWKTAVRAVTSAQTLADERFVAASQDRNLRRRAIAFERQCQRTLELMSAYPDGRTARFIRDTLGMSGDRIDRRRPIVTYARVQVTDLSESAIKTTGLPGPDPMTYDIGTGQFVGRGNAPARGAAGVRDAGTRPAAAGSTCLNLDLIRQLEQGLRQPVGNAAQASHPQPEEPLTACAAPLPSAAPGSEASSESQSGRDTGQESGRDTGLENAFIASGI